MTTTFRFDGGHAPGITDALPDPDYRRDPALSNSELKGITNPFRFQQNRLGRLPKKESAAMTLGTLFHMRVLEPDRWERDVVVTPPEYEQKRTNVSKAWHQAQAEAGKLTIKPDDLEMVDAMVSRLHGVLDGCRTEVSCFSDSAFPVPTKCRVDAIRELGVGRVEVFDLKTIREGHGSPGGFAKAARNLQYHHQQWFYTQILRSLGWTVERWVWLVIETEKPYCVGSYELTTRDMDVAKDEVEEKIDTLMWCLKEDRWPDYSTDLRKPRVVSLFDNMAGK